MGESQQRIGYGGRIHEHVEVIACDGPQGPAAPLGLGGGRVVGRILPEAQIGAGGVGPAIEDRQRLLVHRQRQRPACVELGDKGAASGVVGDGVA
jgi:hypothetical protein